MNSESKRSYRKNLITNGLVYIDGEELEASVINVSVTGALVQLSRDVISPNDTLISKIIDFYLPKLRLAGTAEIVRVNSSNERYDLLALKFQQISYNIDNLLYKRKVYRKNMSVSGQILLKNKLYNFETINVSVEGFMIHLAEKVIIEKGSTTVFKFNNLDIKGKAEVVWVDIDSEGKTLLGLKYINMNTDKIKDIPRFSC